MKDILYTNTVGNLTTNIIYDQFAESPRESDDFTVASFFFVTKHLRINELEIDDSCAESWEDIEDIIHLKHGNDIALIKPVYMYKHSGISLSYGETCPFDSGRIGYSVLLKSKIREMQNIKRVTQKYIDQEEKAMDTELSHYSNWLNGDAYIVEVEEKGSIMELYGTFYDLNDAIEQSNEILDTQVKEQVL